MTAATPRADIYYWKCDRAAAFHGTAQGEARQAGPELEALVRRVVRRNFGFELQALRPGPGQGNHLTYVVTVAGREWFVRLEDGPERDDYMAVETCVMGLVAEVGIPTPRILAADATRSEVPFAWQIMELVGHPDLNRHLKAGTLAQGVVAERLGGLVATWQRVPVEGFGPFDVALARTEGRLRGLHRSYPDYFFTRFEAHLAFLQERGFLTAARIAEIRDEVGCHQALLDLPQGCLVHKDLALWNVLGTNEEIAAVIDWDDCVSADPMDDLSLLACFHDGAFLRRAFAGYGKVRPLPLEYRRRFWLHLLRNMLFKAVIRVGAGYFELSGNFFLIGSGASGADLRQFTLNRLARALDGLRKNADPFTL